MIADIYFDQYILLDTEIRTEFLHAIFYFDMGIHTICLFGQLIKFQL